MNDSISFDHPSIVFFESELFKRIQLEGLFNDSKTICDATPRSTWKEVVEQYERQKSLVNFSLVAFVDSHFTLPANIELNDSTTKVTLKEYIQQLWSKLIRQPDPKNTMSTLLALDHSYIVPGGRFREIYYWDSYFTALGLKQSGYTHLIKDMVLNFIELQERLGCIPNGNRSYYFSRSQPPVLGMMVELCVNGDDASDTDFVLRCIEGMEQEHRFWMHSEDKLVNSGEADERVVRMPCGAILNRYWDNLATPRTESYLEDIELAQDLPHEQRAEFYRNIRAACESGWDFSSRWLDDSNELASIETTQIVPVDLNCLLYRLERNLAKYHGLLNHTEQATAYSERASARKKAINQYCWSSQKQFYFDYHFAKQQTGSVLSLAATLPLFVNVADAEQARGVKESLMTSFMKAGGLVTTLNVTSQQWDSPNGWAPLQWFAVIGLRNYGYGAEARSVMQRWLKTVDAHFIKSGNIMEKYNVQSLDSLADGGEYEVQQGFGWTNGVTLAFYDLLYHSTLISEHSARV